MNEWDRALALSRSVVSDLATQWTLVWQAPRPWGSLGRNTGVGCHFLLQRIFPTQGLNLALLHCRQILYPLSHLGSSCVSDMKVKVTQSCPTLCNPRDYTVRGILQARILEWLVFSLLQGIFPSQGLNPGLPHCRRILYQLSHKGSPEILEWVACPFSSGSSRPRNRTGVSSFAGRFFTNWVIREAVSDIDVTSVFLGSLPRQ